MTFVRQNAKESSVSHDESPWRNPDRHHSRPSAKYSVRQLPLRGLLMRVPPERCSRYNAALQLRSFILSVLMTSPIFDNSSALVTLMNELEGLENGVIVRDCFEVCQKMSTKHEWPRIAGNSFPQL